MLFRSGDRQTRQTDRDRQTDRQDRQTETWRQTDKTDRTTHTETDRQTRQRNRQTLPLSLLSRPRQCSCLSCTWTDLVRTLIALLCRFMSYMVPVITLPSITIEGREIREQCVRVCVCLRNCVYSCACVFGGGKLCKALSWPMGNERHGEMVNMETRFQDGTLHIPVEYHSITEDCVYYVHVCM